MKVRRSALKDKVYIETQNERGYKQGVRVLVEDNDNILISLSIYEGRDLADKLLAATGALAKAEGEGDG